MLEVYEITKLNMPLIVKIFAWSAVAMCFTTLISGIVYFVSDLTKRAQKIIRSITTTSFCLFIATGVLFMTSIAAMNPSKSANTALSKDQYKLKVINQQIVRPEKDNHIMRIDGTSFDALKIITETNESYIVEGTSNDNSLHKVLELKKNDYNFERK